jgi:hypothetical protein
MLTPERILRLTIEIIFLLLGVLVAWLGTSWRIFFDRRAPIWMILSVALIVWGLWALYSPGPWWKRGENWTRGLSLTLLGIVMLAISRVPFHWVGPLLGIAGSILVLRGIIGSALVVRSR